MHQSFSSDTSLDNKESPLGQNMHAFGVWEETGVPEENTKNFKQEGPSRMQTGGLLIDTTAPNTITLCSHQKNQSNQIDAQV